MANKSWNLKRRTFLRGAGVGLSLPWLECMSTGHADAAIKQLPKRLCSVYVPFGVSLPAASNKYAKWSWFPTGKGKDFKFTETLKSLEPHRKKVTVIGGLSHLNGRKMGGHDTGDIFLTGAYMGGGKMTNSVSIDQLVAAKHGQKTRFGSLVLSSDGGVGEPTRAMTTSFSKEGRPIPAMNKPAQIYARLFGVETGESAKAAKRQLVNSSNMLDRVLAHSKELKGQLGKHDQNKFDEYLDAVRTIEQRVERAQAWLDIPKPKVDPKTLKLTSSPAGPAEFLETIFDLMALAFQTDSTRTATYMVGQVAGATTIANAFPTVVGLNGNWHGLAHGAKKKDGYEKLGKFDQFLIQNLARFLDRLDAMPEADGTVLDRTVILYGSSNSNTHQNTNYPLLLAGGGKLGLKHGQYLRYDKNVPMTNLLLTMLNRVDVPTKKFVDSTGELSELI